MLSHTFLHAQVVVQPSTFCVTPFFPLDAFLAIDGTRSIPLEVEAGTFRDTQEVVVPVVDICHFCYLQTFHSFNGSSWRPSHTWVLLVALRAEEVVTPLCMFGFASFFDFHASVAFLFSGRAPSKVSRPGKWTKVNVAFSSFYTFSVAFASTIFWSGIAAASRSCLRPSSAFLCACSPVSPLCPSTVYHTSMSARFQVVFNPLAPFLLPFYPLYPWIGVVGWAS